MQAKIARLRKGIRMLEHGSRFYYYGKRGIFEKFRLRFSGFAALKIRNVQSGADFK
jgi:hypothetical protein